MWDAEKNKSRLGHMESEVFGGTVCSLIVGPRASSLGLLLPGFWSGTNQKYSPL